MSESPVKYRADIDGLRALAVLAVIAFHIGLYRVPGGFVGVDVFFVISGFLICSLLYGDIEAGRFSLTRFYERRIRRILPALILVLVVTTAAAAFVLMPSRFADYGRSLGAAALSFSNFFFWQEAGYFNSPAATKPLLHTWSLAVEEQFYLAFPLLLALLSRFRRSVIVAILAAIALLSLVASAIGAFEDQSATFYLPFTRAWELLLGALLALGAVNTPRGIWAHLVGIIGLALILLSSVVLTEATPFPGLAALPPCLGAAMVILAGRTGEGVVARLLSFPPIVLIGLMSYSLYLWHWPLIVLFREQAMTPVLNHIQQAEIFALCFGLSLLSWLFVERPMRRIGASRKMVFATAGAGTLVVVAAAGALIATRGLPQRFPVEIARVAAFADYDGAARLRTGACFIDSSHNYAQFRVAECLRDRPGESSILLLGDSHAAHLWAALVSELPGRNVMQATASGCAPTVTHLNGATRCRRMMEFIYNSYLTSHHVDLVVLSAAWMEDDAAPLAETMDWARAHNIALVVLGPSVTYDAPLPLLLARELQTGDRDFVNRRRIADIHVVDRQIAQIAVAHHTRYVSTYDIMCPNGRCFEFVRRDIPMQYDTDHLTTEGAQFVVRRLDLAGAFGAVGAGPAPRCGSHDCI